MIRKHRKAMRWIAVFCAVACIGGVVALLIHQTESATKKVGYR